MVKNVGISVIIILTFLMAYYCRLIFSSLLGFEIQNEFVDVLYFYVCWLIPIVVVTGLIYGFRNLYNVFGLSKGFPIGILFAFITVMPMFISSAIIGNVSTDIKLFSLFHTTVLAGFFEEVFFRAFLFGILYRKLKWGFIPASVLGAFFFGLGHIYQGNNVLHTIGVFFVTAIGAAWFAWLYVEWENNLWVPIFLHIFMNFSWIFFEVGSNALGGVFINIFRAVTIALTILITILYHKKNGLKIKKRNLLINEVY